MVVEAARDIRATIREYIDGGLGNGLSLAASAEHALELLIGDGLGDAVLRAVGPDALADIWRKRQQEIRKRAEQGRRRVDTGELQAEDSLLECLYEVGGRWVALGDLSSTQCRTLAVEYATQARTFDRKGRAFLRLEESLKAGQTVRQRYTDDQLRVLFNEGA